ncbi:DUF167 domain-containing protein [Myxococcota bacterium]|nr:DUF167 domain-containing protein [Myxococcota bacterium]
MRVQPGARRDEVVGVVDGALRVKVRAPPVEGAANEAVRRLLAKEVLGIAPSRVVLARGESSRDKEFEVRGLTPDEVRAAVEAASP